MIVRITKPAVNRDGLPEGALPEIGRFPVIAGFKALPLSKKKRGPLSGFLKLSAMFLIIQIKIYNSSKKA